MVVCKYFQQGSCRFGRNCRFEHIYGSKYSYHANQAPQQVAVPSASGVSDEQLVAQVMTDVQSILRGGQWLLTSYAPFKDKPNFPGFNDLSFEEARLFIYEAKANNTLDNAIEYFNYLVKEAKLKYEALSHPTPNIIQVLRSIYNGEVPPSPFDSQQSQSVGSTSNAASVFRNAAQGNSVFGQNNQPSSIFGQSTQAFGGQGSSQTSSLFGQQSQVPASSIFAQANQSIFGQANQQLNQNQPSMFASSQQNQQGSNIFASAAQNAFGNNSIFNQTQAPVASSSPFSSVMQQNTDAQSVFAQTNQQSSNIFTQNNAQANIFAQANSNMGGSPFGQNSSIFGQQNLLNDDETGIYSRLEDLAEDDIEMYKSEDFKLGFIPELPPPKALCL